MDVCRDCCVLSSRGLCDELINRLEESYRMWSECNWDTSQRSPPPTRGCRAV